MADAEAADIAHCDSCGSAMDVTEVAPFTNVDCAGCGKQTRVKREFGPYTLVRRQGVGGMSLVFVAHDNTLQRELALKILNQDQSRSEKRIAQFEEEARITASISHPHVVRVFTTGHAFDRFYIAMELVGGGHLEQKIHERGAIPEAEVLPFAIEIAQGLSAAHARGLIHRDIKPGNILFDAEGHAKIVDFGLALVTKGGTATAEEIWATPYYVPPETVDGAAEDFRSDIYALGATLYHALAGRPSCAEDSMSSNVLREAKRQITPIGQVAPWLSPETCAVVDRSMAYSPADRYSSYDELIGALQAALNRGETGQPIHSAARIRRRTEMGPAAWAAALGGAAALVGLLVWAMGGSSGSGRVVPVVTQPAAVATPASENANAARASAAQIAELYGAAGKAMAKGDFEDAGKRFSALMEKPGVIEPTGSWGGFEAMVAAYLEGDAGKARSRAAALLGHLKGLSPQPDVGESFAATARSVLQVAVIPAANQPSGSSPPALMGLFACGLKNWEQGALDQAAESFRRFADTRLGPDDQWLSIYQGYARRYLADYAALNEAAPGAEPETPEACKKLADGWNAMLDTLETRGRARFNVKCWQRAAEQRARMLERTAAGKELPQAWQQGRTLAEVIAEVQPLLKAGKFAAAVELLKSAEAEDGEAAEQKAWLYIAQSAGDFLLALEKGCADRRLDVPMASQDGRRFAACVGAEPAGLRVVDDGGEQTAIPWAEMAPESLTALHTVLLRGEPSEVEKVRRHEGAIAYMWLAGDKGKAGTAASRIDNAEFRERWSAAMKVLEKPGE